MSDNLVNIADGVWLFPHDPDPNRVQPAIGVICTATETVLIDGGNSPTHGRRVLAALRELDVPPIRYLIYTHNHWDHVFGAQVFEAPIIAHVRCREWVAKMAAQPWGKPFLVEQTARRPALKALYERMDAIVGDWSELRIVVPTITFTDRLTLHLDGLTLELQHVGGQHAADSIVVRVPERGVIFLGDSFYPPPAAAGSSITSYDQGVLAACVSQDINTYVHSHGLPFTYAQALQYMDQTR
jgi:glyoxylase-like metal-dependent hydrolase (beta-lactamase superfamily II)